MSVPRYGYNYATPSIKKQPTYKKALRMEKALARKYPGLFSRPIPPNARREFEAVMKAWNRAHFYGWADNYRAALARKPARDSVRSPSRGSRDRRSDRAHNRNSYIIKVTGYPRLNGEYEGGRTAQIAARKAREMMGHVRADGIPVGWHHPYGTSAAKFAVVRYDRDGERVIYRQNIEDRTRTKARR